jgi:plastocyanin
MRERLLLPVVVPVGAAGLIFLLIFSMGKLLLELDPAYATVVAIGIALLILATCTLLAVGPRLPPTQLYLITGAPIAIIIGIGLYLAVQPRPAEPETVLTAIAEIATDNKFSVTSVRVPVNTEVTLTLENRGVALHNWHVLNLTDAQGKEIKTELLSGGASQTIRFTIDKVGVYNFQCDVHPVEMRGQLAVVSAAPTATSAEQGPGGGTPTATPTR